MAVIAISYTLLAILELWRGRGDGAWRWPIMLLLFGHAAAIPIQIPLAGTWNRPDPADLDLLTFMIFETAFVCICAGYLFSGLVKDRIAASYQRASVTDPLTGVANRRDFFQTGERLLTRTRFARQPIALLMFDLDQFKSINDRYGHHAGDEVLNAFCKVATSHIRPTDLFGRIGGEEFAALLSNTNRQDALSPAERVREAFGATPHSASERAFSSTCSVGVAVAEDGYSDLKALLDAADQALYRAKALGRNRVEPSPHRAERRPMIKRALTK